MAAATLTTIAADLETNAAAVAAATSGLTQANIEGLAAFLGILALRNDITVPVLNQNTTAGTNLKPS